MKNTKTQIVSLSFAVLLVFSFGFKNVTNGPGDDVFGPNDKITICHMPPGNPDNCQEITISYNAFQTHMDHHGDALVCKNAEELPKYKILSDMTSMNIYIAFSGNNTSTTSFSGH